MRTAIVIALLLSMAACAGPAATPTAPVPSATPPSPSQPTGASQSPNSPNPQPPDEPDPLDPALAFLRYSCGGHAFGLDLLAVPGRAELENHPSAEALRTFLATPNMDADFLPAGGWHLAGRDEESASYVAAVAAAGGEPPFVTAMLTFANGAWTPTGWGQCRPELATEGANPATFQFAGPAPDSGATRFDVDVTEGACASGRPMGARLRPPTIVETDRFVYMLFTATRQDGFQDCPGNPATRVTVELPVPVGDRRVLDVAVFPFHDPSSPWPN